MSKPPFAARAAALLVTAALAVALAACGSTGPSAVGRTVAVSDGAVTVTAVRDLAFDASVIQAPANQAFTITLVNNDIAPHNISVYTAEGGERIVLGDIINEGQTTDIAVPALAPGTYYWVCDLHTMMNGTLVVGG